MWRLGRANEWRTTPSLDGSGSSCSRTFSGSGCAVADHGCSQGLWFPTLAGVVVYVQEKLDKITDLLITNASTSEHIT